MSGDSKAEFLRKVETFETGEIWFNSPEGYTVLRTVDGYPEPAPKWHLYAYIGIGLVVVGLIAKVLMH